MKEEQKEGSKEARKEERKDSPFFFTQKMTLAN
jgi:hypothetical protein